MLIEMRPRLIATIFMLTLFPFISSAVREGPAAEEQAGERQSGKPRFAYDVDFDFNFDNREYDRSSFSESMTIFGARLTPSVGLVFQGKEGSSHKLMLGIDIMKDFGASPISPEIAGEYSDEVSSRQNNLDLFREIVLYYSWGADFGKTGLELTAGIFPRKMTRGRYPSSFFSDSLKFYDNNLEGLLFSVRRPSSYYELGCDWMGQYGQARRERFMLFSSGESRLLDWLVLGYSAYMYHFAGAKDVEGVVDNILVNPWVCFDLSGRAGMQRLGASLGWLQSMQNDRRNIGKYAYPCGGELVLEARNWNVGIENRLFYGTDMMPYYDNRDAIGIKYGNMLYFGDIFYRVNEDHSGHGFYDRLEVYYEPSISRFLSLKLSVVMHFNGGFSGWQQKVTLNFRLFSQMSKNRGR